MAGVFVGTDLVHIPGLAEQLGLPGSRFEMVFSAGELRVAASKSSRGPRGRAEHLAGRWAAKEAFVKAWSQALYGRPPVLAEADVDWAGIEIRPDRWGRVGIALAPEIAAAVAESLGKWEASLSISHDGDYATATCIIVVH